MVNSAEEANAYEWMGEKERGREKVDFFLCSANESILF